MATNRGSPWALEMINKSLIKHQLIEDRAPTRRLSLCAVLYCPRARA
jgi:hypothetical protein